MDAPLSTKPRYLRATLVCTLAAAVIPVAGFILGSLDAREGPPISGPEAQGAFILLSHAAVAVIFVGVAFPVVALRLHGNGALTKRRFYRDLFIALIGASFLPAVMLVLVGFGLGSFVFVPVGFVVLAILALPFRWLWWRLAQ